MRADLYKLIHKAQRQRLFELSIRIGKTNFAEQRQSLSIKEDLHKMIVHLRKHAENEETFIHPLYHIANDKLVSLESQHTQLESLIEKLEKIIVGEQTTCMLYDYFNRFVAIYLQHIDEEENLQKQLLWKYYNDEDLIEVMRRFQQSLSPEQILDNMEFMLPCLSTDEVINILKNMKNSISRELFQRISIVFEEAFDRNEWEKIKSGCFF